MPLPGGGGDTGTLTVQQIAAYWEAAGGPRGKATYAVAVALAESGGDPGVVSPSSDYGVWQINRIHFGDGIIGWSNWSDPLVNAREAVKLSGHGANWAAWCTAWAHPAGNCGHGHLAAPQQGSPAGREMPLAANLLGSSAVALGLDVKPAAAADMQHSWSYLQKWLGIWGPNSHNNIQSYTALINTAKAVGRISI